MLIICKLREDVFLNCETFQFYALEIFYHRDSREFKTVRCQGSSGVGCGQQQSCSVYLAGCIM